MNFQSVIITGAKGYIGQNLIRYLNSKGVFKIYEIDKVFGTRIEDVDILLKADLVIHLAALSGIPDCENNPEDAISTNIFGSYNILDLAYKNQIPVLLASSQAAKSPSSNLYATTKATMELFAKKFNTLGSNNKILRFSNVFGGIEYLNTKKSVISCFINAKQNNELAQIHGTGKQTRDFIHVNELCRIIYDIILIYENITETTIDVGTGFPLEIKDVVDFLNLDYEYNLERTGGELINFADISVLEKYNIKPADLNFLYKYLEDFK